MFLYRRNNRFWLGEIPGKSAGQVPCASATKINQERAGPNLHVARYRDCYANSVYVGVVVTNNR
jgi:hypothetical protein